MEFRNRPASTMGTDNLFELQIDQQNTAYLNEIARWAKFLAIAGFVLCGLMVLAFLLQLVLSSSINLFSGGTSATDKALVLAIIVVALLLYLLPCLYLFNFAIKMQVALRSNDQNTLNTSFGSLKSCFKFVGVFTIVILSFYVLFIVFELIGSLVA